VFLTYSIGAAAAPIDVATGDNVRKSNLAGDEIAFCHDGGKHAEKPGFISGQKKAPRAKNTAAV
jgi:hypothetical protein